MKTNQIIIWAVISIILTSCFSENYKIVTQVDRDGSCHRSMSTLSDSAFLAGDRSDNPFPYEIDSHWTISSFDTLTTTSISSEKRDPYVKIAKKFNSVEDLSIGWRSDMIFPTPKESLKKRFRWFYTYYTYTAKYPEINDKGSVPMDKYLNGAEQKLYFQDDMSGCVGMSGMELKSKLDEIEAQFLKWYTRSMYENNFEVISHYASEDFHPQLTAIKDTLYLINGKQMSEEASINDICMMLDKYFVTDRFSKLYVENMSGIDHMLDEKTKVIDNLMNFNIDYELTLPGKIISANTELRNNNALSWKVDALRFLTDDYILTAESRAVNIWAFALTFLLILFAMYAFRKSV